MKNLITSIASIILFAICFLQFAADLNTYVSITKVNDTIEKYRIDGYDKSIEGYSEKIEAKIKQNLGEINNVEDVEVMADDTRLQVSYYITHIIGPDRMINFDGIGNKRKFERDIYWGTP